MTTNKVGLGEAAPNRYSQAQHGSVRQGETQVGTVSALETGTGETAQRCQFQYYIAVLNPQAEFSSDWP